MKVTQKAVRVYESAAYIDTPPHTELPDAPITVEPLHLEDGATPSRALLYLGKFVPWVLEANQIRRAFGRLTLNLYRGISFPSDPESAIGEMLTQIDPIERRQDAWYVTIIVEQDTDVPDDGITGGQFVWLVDNTFERARQFQVLASPYLDRLSLLASTIMAPSAFEKMIIHDHDYFSAVGKRIFGLPVGRMTARLQVSRPLHSLDAAALESRLRASVTLTAKTLEWLDVVTPWWLAGLREEDPWKAFMQSFIGLELLHERLVKRYYDWAKSSARVHGSDLAVLESTPVLAILLNRDRTDICPLRELSSQGEFAVIALALFPHNADTDFEIFTRIKKLRNKVAHGNQAITGTIFPLAELRELLGRYLDAAIQDHQSAKGG